MYGFDRRSSVRTADGGRRNASDDYSNNTPNSRSKVSKIEVMGKLIKREGSSHIFKNRTRSDWNKLNNPDCFEHRKFCNEIGRYRPKFTAL